MFRMKFTKLATCVTAAAVGAVCSVGINLTAAAATTAAYPNAKTAFDYFTAKGLTKVQAAGIVGNLQEESYPQINPTQWNGGYGHGIAQWSINGRWDTEPQDNVIWFASVHGQDKYSLNLQLDFIWYELQTFPSQFGTVALNQATTVTDATLAFQNKYEQCGSATDCEQSKRLTFANDALSLYGGTAPPPASSFGSAFQANTGYLWTEAGGVGTNQGQGMHAGTSPAMTTVSGQHETAFQANTGNLIVIGPVRANTGQPMRAGTNPAIAASGSSFEVAYQGSDGNLRTWTPTGGAVNQGQGMKPGTSPAITAVRGGYEIALQANTGILIVIGPTRFNTSQPMRAATNPAITATGSTFQVAYQGSDGNLRTWIPGNAAVNQGQGMKDATSPAITAVTGGTEIAFQANTGYLIVIGAAARANTGQGMKTGTSPAITGTTTNTFHVAFQTNTGRLYTWTNTGHITDTGLGMNNTTSPATAS